MKYINRYAFAITVICLLYFLANFFQLKQYDNKIVDGELSSNIDELKQKIELLEELVQSKENDINNLKEAFVSNVRYYNNLVERFNLNQTFNLSYTNKSTSLLDSSVSSNEKNAAYIIQTKFNYDVDLPNSFDFLPHLNGHLTILQPKLKFTKNRYASLVIGIPTIKRDKTSYLLETIKSLFDSMNDKEKENVLVVIMIAELSDGEFVQKTVESITHAFKLELESGLIDILVPPVEFYPNLDDIANKSLGQNTFNDPFERVKWRTKQNYDFSYLMSYAIKRGMYYLQLEDDVVSKSGCITIIFDFIKKQKTDKWLILEFTQLGFIGKLFKTRNLPLFINFFLMFASDKPVDWLSDSALLTRACDPEKSHAHCERAQIGLRARFKPSLFQHVGVQSSLKGKTQKLKDKDFGKQLMVLKQHANPPAYLSTSLKTYMKYTLESAYLGQNYFWTFSPAANDYILFEFNEPYLLLKYYIKSGSPEHPDDKLFNSTVQIQPEKQLKEIPRGYYKTTDDFYIVGRFSHDLGVASGNIDINVFGKISKFRVHISTASENWILISEIDFSNTANVVNSSPKAS